MKSTVTRRGVQSYTNNNYNINRHNEVETTRRLVPYFRKAFMDEVIPIMKQELRKKTTQLQIDSGLYADHDGNVIMSIASALRRQNFKVLGCRVADWCSLSGQQGLVNVWVQLPYNFPDEAERNARRRNRLDYNGPDIAYMRTSLVDQVRESVNKAMRGLNGKHVVLAVGEGRCYLPAQKGGRQENAARRKGDEALQAWKIWNLKISKAHSDVEVSFRKTAERIEDKLMDWMKNGSIPILEHMAAVIPPRDRVLLLEEYERAKNEHGQGFRLLQTPAEKATRGEFDEAFVQMRRDFKPWLTSRLAKKHWYEVYREEKKEDRKRRQEAKALDPREGSPNKKSSSNTNTNTAPLDLSKSRTAPLSTGSIQDVLINSYREPGGGDDGQQDLLRSIHGDIQETEQERRERMEVEDWELVDDIIDIASPERPYSPGAPIGENWESLNFTSVDERGGSMEAGNHSRRVHFDILEEEDLTPEMETSLYTPECVVDQSEYVASPKPASSALADGERDKVSNSDLANFIEDKDLVLSKSPGLANSGTIPRDLVFPPSPHSVPSMKPRTGSSGTKYGARDGNCENASGPSLFDQNPQETTPIPIEMPVETDENPNNVSQCKGVNPEKMMQLNLN